MAFRNIFAIEKHCIFNVSESIMGFEAKKALRSDNMNHQMHINNEDFMIDQSNCEAFFNDELKPIANINLETALSWVHQMPQDTFALEYYEDDCESCPPTPRSKKRLVPFIEGHFYIFTKQQNVVMTSVDPVYQQGIFDVLLAKGEADDSYILSIVLCPKCKKFQIEIELCDM